MLNSYCKGAAALAAVLTFSATAAQAETHEVLIVDGSYFPSVIIAAEGDEVLFRNESGATHVITADDDKWTSGEIDASGIFVLALESEEDDETEGSEPESFATSFTGTGGGFEEAIGEIVLALDEGGSDD